MNKLETKYELKVIRGFIRKYIKAIRKEYVPHHEHMCPDDVLSILKNISDHLENVINRVK